MGRERAGDLEPQRAAVTSWLLWCQTRKHWAAPSVPCDAERRKETADETRAVAKATIHQLLSRRDIPLREKTLWRMLYETPRAAGILALNVEDLDLEHRRAPVRWQGRQHRMGVLGAGRGHLLPRLPRLSDGSTRTHGSAVPGRTPPRPARRPAAADSCPHTGRARLGCGRARVLLDEHAGLDLPAAPQCRHPARRSGDPLQLIMGRPERAAVRDERAARPGDARAGQSPPAMRRTAPVV